MSKNQTKVATPNASKTDKIRDLVFNPQYDKYGYDVDGYNRDGYNRGGFNRNGKWDIKQKKDILTEEEYRSTNFRVGDVHGMYVKMQKDGKILYGSLMEGYWALTMRGYMYVEE